jgi:TRAP-type C4-dicarboxylate transport system permease small subunit
MKEKIKRIGLVLSAVLMLSIATLGTLGTTSVSYAAPKGSEACAGAQFASGDVNCATDDSGITVSKVVGWVGTVTQWLLYAVGAVCVIFIIIGGIKYATSGGDSEKVKKAKDTLLYALIGLAIAILAGFIVSLVVNALTEVRTTT